MRNLAAERKKGEKRVKRIYFRGAAAAVLCICMSFGASAARMLIPVGKVVGLSLADGSVTVAEFSEELGESARRAGLKVGDDIRVVDGRPVDSAAQLHEALSRSDGTVELTVGRGGKEHSLTLEPEVTAQGPRLGVWIREGVTGIGTVTYYDPESGSFGALGHGISTGGILAQGTGNIYPAMVSGLRRGQAGTPGQLRGSVMSREALGTLTVNCGRGIFGQCGSFSGEPLPVGMPRAGRAQILCNVTGDRVERYEVEITSLSDSPNPAGRDMELKVTDPALLETTGGIIAGMSGSPIIQDGKIVGAVTHVLVNDPTRGYGIFIENMLEAAG